MIGASVNLRILPHSTTLRVTMTAKERCNEKKGNTLLRRHCHLNLRRHHACARSSHHPNRIISRLRSEVCASPASTQRSYSTQSDQGYYQALECSPPFSWDK